MIIVNQQTLHYGVIREPIRSLVDCGVASDVETVVVDGEIVMENRHIPDAQSLPTLLKRAQGFAEAYWAAYPQLDWSGRSASEAFASVFPWAETSASRSRHG